MTVSVLEEEEKKTIRAGFYDNHRDLDTELRDKVLKTLGIPGEENGFFVGGAFDIPDRREILYDSKARETIRKDIRRTMCRFFREKGYKHYHIAGDGGESYHLYLNENEQIVVNVRCSRGRQSWEFWTHILKR